MSRPQNTDKAIYGIIGHPLTHSLSPAMHNAAFHALGVAAEYRLFPLREDEVAPFIEALKDPVSPIFGLNVTVPYKETVVPLMDHLSPFARQVGAVNTVVVNTRRELIGHNTDGPGFLAHLTQWGFDPSGKAVAVAGAGGTARAIVCALCLIPERPAVIYLHNRTVSRAQRLLDDLGQRLDVSVVRLVDDWQQVPFEAVDCVINTTSLGLRSADPSPVPTEMLHAGMWVYDVIYNPAETALLKAAKKKGANITNGVDMLFYQGALALQHWAEQPIEEPVKQAMREALTNALAQSRRDQGCSIASTEKDDVR